MVLAIDVYFVSLGVIHQYDSVAYPHVKSNSKVVKAVKTGFQFLKSFFVTSASTTENEVVLPDQDTMQAEALKIYLQRYKDELCELKFASQVRFPSEEIMDIFGSLHFVWNCKDNCSRGNPESYLCKSLPEVRGEN